MCVYICTPPTHICGNTRDKRAKTILKNKNGVAGNTLSDNKTYYKTIVMRALEIAKREDSIEIHLHISSELIFLQ